METQGIIVIVMTLIVLYNLDSNTTIRMVMSPIIGFMVVMDFIFGFMDESDE